MKYLYTLTSELKLRCQVLTTFITTHTHVITNQVKLYKKR